MKCITFFISSLSSGGAEHQLAILANLLVEKEYQVKIITYIDTPDHYPISEKIERIRLGANKANWLKVINIWYYFFNIKQGTVIAFGSFCSFLAIPSIVFHKHVSIIAGERCIWGDKIPWYEKVNLSFLYHRAKYIVPNSNAQSQQIIARNPVYGDKVRTIINYTDINKYIVKPLAHHSIIRIGVFARYEEQKNILRFLQAVYNITKEGHSGFVVEWFGSKSLTSEVQIQYYKECVDAIERLGLSEIVRFNDKTNKVAELIPEFDALCLPSLVEGFSNSLSEYICCGRPVICSNVADNSVMVHDGENGFLFDPTNVSSITSALRQILTSSFEQRSAMGNRSREIAESLFNRESFVNSYISLF